jgi:hypothetical protein
MPFVGGNVQAYQIIRRPVAGESPTSATGTSREYNMAQIHVLLSDDPTELSSGGAADANNIRLANVTQAQATATGTPLSNPFGVAMTAGNYGPGFAAPTGGNTYNLYFAAASNGLPSACSSTSCPSDWPYPPAPWTSTMATAASSPYPLLVPTGAPLISGSSTLNGTGSNTNNPPTFVYCPTSTVPPQNYAPLPGNVPSTCPSPLTTVVAPYYYENGVAVKNTVASQDPAAEVLANQTATWNLIDGWLRVEYKDAAGAWHPVTSEWLKLGFARDVTSPTANGAGSPAGGVKNPINPNAILLLQEPADRVTATAGAITSQASLSTLGAAPVCTATSRVSGVNYCTAWSSTPPQVLMDTLGSTVWQFGTTPASPTTQSVSMFNWYPINFYDAREGEPRDTVWAGTYPSDNSCTTTGIMNAVEIDVGNLKRWLLGSIGTNGTNVDYAAQNGYVLYYSDRRGMLPNPNAVGVPPCTQGTKCGDSGLEDVINSSSAPGTPDGVLEPTPTGRSGSPEDVNQNGVLDNFGTANLGLGFYGTGANATLNLNYQIIAATPDDPYGTSAYNRRIASCSIARKNWVSGARHVLKLVDASFGNVPLSPIGTLTDPGGFTVAAENPVYVLGDYNTYPTDPFWSGGTDIIGHSSAAVIADAVTMLSKGWADQYTILGDPANAGNFSPSQADQNRPAQTTFYRLAVAGGKNLAFPFPSWENSTDYGFGTDGGVHNFLRFLEDWQSGGATLNYGGSLVSLYYSTYATGPFKCCEYSVYEPPTRNYIFDNDFTLPQGLPPGTPLFRDVDSLGYRQLFATRNN